MSRTCGVGEAGRLSGCCSFQVHQLNARCDIAHMRKKGRVRGRMDRVELSEKVDDRPWSKSGANRQTDLETGISRIDF